MNVEAKRGNRRVVDVLFALALFCVFAAASLIVVLIGANVYRSTVDRMEIGFEINTSLTFVSTRIRQHDQAGGVRIDQLGQGQGQNAIVFRQEIGERAFDTWLYYHDGALREITISADGPVEFRPESGQELARIHAFEIEMAYDRLIAITAHSSYDVYSRILVGLRAEAGH